MASQNPNSEMIDNEDIDPNPHDELSYNRKRIADLMGEYMDIFLRVQASQHGLNEIENELQGFPLVERQFFWRVINQYKTTVTP